MSIKLLIVSNYNNSNSARPEAELVIGLQKEGFDITVLTGAKSEYAQKFRATGIKVIDFKFEKKLDTNKVKFIRSVLVSGEFKIVQLFNNRALIHGIKAAKNLPVKVVAYRGYTSNMSWYDLSFYSKHLHPKVSKIICVSEGVRQSLMSHFLFKKEKAVTIYKGHSLDWYKNIKPIDLEELSIPQNSFVVCCVANIRPMKGFKYLLNATYELPLAENIHFLLVGEGMEKPEFQNIISQSPYKNKIHKAGFRNNVLEYIAAADALVLPSIKGEGLSKVVIEAMALQKAVIATNIPGNDELISDMESGLLIPSKSPKAIAEAIYKLHKNKDLCSKLGKNAQTRIKEKFNNTDTVKNVRRLYESLVK